MEVNFKIIKQFNELGKVEYYQKEVTVTDKEGNIENYKCENVTMTSRQASALGKSIIKMAKEGKLIEEINQKVNHLLYQDG